MIDGVPMLERVVTLMESPAAMALGVIVVIGAHDHDVLPDSHHVATRALVANPDPDRGMFSSIQIGMAEALERHAEIVLVHPADMPFVRPETVAAIVTECARTGRAVCPRFDTQRGHPLAFPASIAQQLLAVDPSTPLNEAFAAIGLVRHELDVTDPGVLKDVDRRGDVVELVN